MKKRSSALAGLPALGLASFAACAQPTSVSLYGTIDLAIGSMEVQPPGPPNAPIVRTRGLQNGAVQTSYFGVRGIEDLGDGLKAKFVLESFLRVDSGQNGRFNTPASSDPFWSRQAWVGVEGGFGELRLGVNANPTWLAGVYTSAMGSNSLFSPTFRQQYNGSTRGSLGQDTGLPDSVSYLSPRFANTVVTLNAQAGEGRGKGANFNASAVYRDGALVLALAGHRLQHAPSPEPPATLDERFFMAGASYDLKVVRLFAQYNRFKDDLAGLSTRTPHLGLTAPLGVGELQLAWARASTSGANEQTRTTTSAGYLHALSRRTQLYALLANDALPVGTARSYALGIRHTF